VPYAEDHGIDPSVVGPRGQGSVGRWLQGSVARQAITYAPCAVTVGWPHA
jgi:nucleotide-binding universal stress UspA family protein